MFVSLAKYRFLKLCKFSFFGDSHSTVLVLPCNQILYDNTQTVAVRVCFINTQLASSYTNAVRQLASSPSTVDFTTRNFYPLISREQSQTNRCGLYRLSVHATNHFCRCPTCHTNHAVSIRSLLQRPYGMKPTAVAFISLTTVVIVTYDVSFPQTMLNIHSRTIWMYACMCMMMS